MKFYHAFPLHNSNFLKKHVKHFVLSRSYIFIRAKVLTTSSVMGDNYIIFDTLDLRYPEPVVFQHVTSKTLTRVWVERLLRDFTSKLSCCFQIWVGAGFLVIITNYKLYFLAVLLAQLLEHKLSIAVSLYILQKTILKKKQKTNRH